MTSEELRPSVDPKDPDSVLPYTLDWTAWLAADAAQIAQSSWSITGPDADLAIGSGAHAPSVDATGKKATVWLSGGTEGKWYTVTNRIATSETPPREDDRSFRVRILER